MEECYLGTNIQPRSQFIDLQRSNLEKTISDYSFLAANPNIKSIILKL